MKLHRIFFLLLALLLLGRVVLAQPEVVNPPNAPQQPVAPAVIHQGVGMPAVQGDVPLLTLPAPAAPADLPVVRFVWVKYDEWLLNQENQRDLLRGLMAFFPEGSIELRPIPFLHVIVVKAKDQHDIDQLETLLSVLDTDNKKQILLHLTLVKLPLAEADAFAEKSVGVFTNYTDENKRQLKEALENSVAAGKAEIIDIAQVIVQAGSEATINFAQLQPGVPAFKVGAVVHPGDDITLTVVLQPNAVPAGAWPSSIRIHPDTTFILAGGLPLDANAGAEDRSTGMIFITATYCKAGKRVELPPPF